MRIAYRNADLHVGDGSRFTGTMITEDARIAAVYAGDLREADRGTVDRTVDLAGKTVIPGLVDVHTHGRAGFDFTDASVDEMRVMARSYVKSGVTTLMPTLASAPFSDLCAASDRIVSLCGKEQKNGAMLPCYAGVHLEGRYLNPEKRGAHAVGYLAPLDASELKTLIPHFGPRFHVAAALELDADGSFLQTVLDAGGTVSLAHTCATYGEAMDAISRGAVSFTHTFNAMPPLHHRDGGAVAAALTSDAFAELIVDGVHIAPEMVRLAYRLKGSDRLVLVTDSMQATDCSDGVYSIAGLKCIVKDGKALTEDGHLAGSTLSLIDGLRNLMRFCGISLDEALPTATRTPAKLLGIDLEVGTLEAGKYADFLVLNDGFETSADPIASVVLCGTEIV